MTRKHLWRMFVAVFLLLGNTFIPTGVSAQDDIGFELGYVRYVCEDPPHISFSVGGDENAEITHISVHNTSTNWSHETSNYTSYPEGLKVVWLGNTSVTNVDKVFFRAVVDGEPTRVYEYTAFLPGPCDSLAYEITGGLVVDEPTDPVNPEETPTDPEPPTDGNGEANPVTITVIPPAGVVIAGAPFGVYAPAASTLPAGAIFTGTVGANNAISLPDVLPDSYLIKIAPANGDLVEFNVRINPTTNLLVVDLDTNEADAEFVRPVPGEEPFFEPGVTYLRQCGLEIWYAADQSGAVGTLTFSNASGWSQVVNVTHAANTGIMTDSWCIGGLTQTPDTIQFHITTNSGGTFFYHMDLVIGDYPIIVGGLLVNPTTPPTVTPTETPTAVPTETVPATEVPTGTVTPEVTSSLRITVALPDGASIEGAPYNLYAAQAAIVFETEPYRSVVVGTNNTIEIDDLLPGTYKLVISPEGMAPIEAMIENGDQPLTEVRLVVNADGSVTVEDVTPVTPTATAPANGDKKDDVTSLPSTGAGEGTGTMGVMAMLTVAAAALMMAGGLAIRQKRS